MDDEKSPGLEREKLALDRERLAFDRDVFNADAGKRAAEVDKLLAERDKEAADREKTVLESNDLRKKWYRRATILTSLSLPAVVVGLLTAFLGYTGTHNKQQSDIEEARLKAQVGTLTDQKTQAEGDLKQLKDHAKDLNERNAQAEKQYNELLVKQQTLQQSNDTLTTQANSLAAVAELGNVKEYISLLTRDPADSLLASNRYVSEIDRDIESDPSGRKHEFVRHAADDTSSRVEIRALLYESLLIATHDAQYARMIGRLSEQADAQTARTFGSILKTDSFGAKDRSDFICSVYRHAPSKTEEAKARTNILMWLIHYDERALIDCRDPYIELLRVSRDSYRNGDLDAFYRLYSISLEEFVISTIEQSAQSNDAYRKFYQSGGSERLPFLKAFVPKDAYSALTLADEQGQQMPAGSRTQWLESNDKLVSIFAEKDLQTLRTAKGSVFQRIVSGKWVTIPEFE